MHKTATDVIKKNNNIGNTVSGRFSAEGVVGPTFHHVLIQRKLI